ncbi:MAG: hypothetical protein WCE54_13320 [Ignavibacteriaceae bacterium]
MAKTESELIIKEFAEVFKYNQALYKKWIRYSEKLLNNYFNGRGARHYKPDDVVSEILIKLIDGKRKWDMKKLPEIHRLMCMLIKSFVHNLYVKEKKMINFGNFHKDDEEKVEKLEAMNCISLEMIEKEYDMREAMKVCYEIMEEDDDEECLKVMELLRYEYRNPEIADKLKMQKNQVENTKKRLRSKLRKRKISVSWRLRD